MVRVKIPVPKFNALFTNEPIMSAIAPKNPVSPLRRSSSCVNFPNTVLSNDENTDIATININTVNITFLFFLNHFFMFLSPISKIIN